MKLFVLYILLLLLSLMVSFTGENAVICNGKTAEAVVVEKQFMSDECNLVPLSLFINVCADLGTDLAHFTSDCKYYMRLQNKREEQQKDIRYARLSDKHFSYLSFSGPTAYYVFGLREIIV